MGIPIEHEHTKDRDLAMDIALQHLDEIPDYYTRLKKMESSAKKEHSKFKDVKEHCGCEDNAVRELESNLKKLSNTSYNSIDKLMRSIMKKHDLTAKQLHNAFVNKHDKTPDDWIKELKEGTLHHWFKGSKSKDGKPGWVQADGSPCANEPGETKTPKCFSSGRLNALKRKGKKGEALIRSAVRRKRQRDKGQQAKSSGEKSTMVSTFAKGKKDPNYVKAEPAIKESMKLNEATKDKPEKGSGKKDACYYKVKSRYDVWPSAYASGALVKCRKAGAKNWGTKTEEVQLMKYCPKCQKNETRDECKYGSGYWDKFAIDLKKYTPNTPHPGNFPESYDHEHSMARSQLETINSAVKRLRKKMKGEGNLEAWVQSKITKAADYIDTVADYVDSGEMKESNNEMLDEKCWQGYKKKGMKTMFGKRYPNCVKAEEYMGKTFEEFIMEASAAWQRKEGKRESGGLNQKGVESYRRENPGSKLKTAVTTKPSKLKKGSKSWNRRKSFCSRMSGMKAKLTSAKTARDPNSRINKSLRAWNC